MSHLKLLGDTREKIIRYLRKDPMTAREIADKLGIWVSAAREHLEYLVKMGFVISFSRRDTVGRPKKLYRLTEEGMELFQRNYAFFLRNLIETLRREEGEEFLKQKLLLMVKDIIVQAFPERVTQMSPQHISKLIQTLNELGFESRVEKHGSVLTIISENCPILSVAKLYHQLICQTFHNEILKQALEYKTVVLNECMALDDSFCKHVIRMKGQLPKNSNNLWTRLKASGLRKRRDTNSLGIPAVR